jgi:hypothetical protein
LLAGAQTLSLTVTFANTAYTSSLIETVSITMISPCTQTIISASSIANISFNFGSTTLLTPYTDFSDTVSSQYGIANMCALVYSLSLAADATNYGVTLVTGAPNQISVYTTNVALKGTQITLTMSAVATPAQATASGTATFNVIIVDSCGPAIISFTAPAAMTQTVTKAAAS